MRDDSHTTPFSIIIPAFNQLGYCQECIVSLQHCTPSGYSLILVDNGSTDGAGEYFDTVPGAEVVHSETNLGFAGGVNLGLARARGDVVLLNSDTLLSKGWLERLRSALYSAADIGMAGPMSNCAAGPQQLDGLALRSQEEIDAFAEELYQKRAGRVREVVRLVGVCLMIREKVWKEIGLFDEQFGPGNYEDDDYCTRIRRAGYRMAVAEDSFVFHYGGRTFAGMNLLDGAFDQLMRTNRERYSAKWGVRLPERLSPPGQAASLNARAQEALGAGDTAKAMRLLKAAIETCPAARDYNDLGAVLWRVGQHAAAYEFFLLALRQDAAYAPAQDNARQAAEALGRSEDLRAWLLRQGGDPT